MHGQQQDILIVGHDILIVDYLIVGHALCKRDFIMLDWISLRIIQYTLSIMIYDVMILLRLN